ncbi:hypothetical protein HMPREF0454_04461 [Hafnia alvei ATCC 51873]|uniref:Uncharacterized protein n=1 Tax=Hafnia alvei ATCC 51873 TaxID=1002364 RepID=G9YCP6_HAFAL|nr:hypothetical protein HMPREF0454_04461 [Hafnia alvei ATCC 51873]
MHKFDALSALFLCITNFMPLNGAVYVSNYKHNNIILITLGYFAIK